MSSSPGEKLALRVEAAFPGGNVADVTVETGADRVEVGFTPHPHGGPEVLWFNFRLTRAAGAHLPPRTVLSLRNPHNLLGGGQPAHLRPVVRYGDGDWRRLPEPQVEALPDGRCHASWTVDTPATWCEVAVCYPYGAADLAGLLDAPRAYWHSAVIGVSQAGRPLVRLSNDAGQPGGTRPGLYLVARQHSGETPGSWVLDGLLRHWAAQPEGAPLVWAVPLSNIDGVEQGDYGKDNFPYDLNRAWGRPPMRHETLVLKQDLARWRQRCRPALVLDLHAPGACEDSGVYAYLPDPARDPEQHGQCAAWAARLQAALDTEFAAADFARVARYASRWETPSLARCAWAEWRVPALSLETPYALIRGRVLTPEDYREIGRRLAVAVGSATPALASPP